MTAGFIDLHSHGQTPENYGFKARDGVTTALELEVGVNPVSAWYAAREGRALINFGVSGRVAEQLAGAHPVGHIHAKLDLAEWLVVTRSPAVRRKRRVRPNPDAPEDTTTPRQG